MNGCKKAVRFKKNEKKHFVFSYNEVTNIVFEDGGIDVKFNVANHIGTDDDAETERNTVCI
ncbi:MAG: hypothetical protein Q4A15_11320 [Prevotellaceae bacterium]|nr:hypothetical protein [Prevotellaceae bacterium]